jgi:DNA-binding GntR family transcriptional regulator
MQHSPNPVLSPPEPTLVVANDDGDGFTTVAQRTYDQLRQALLNGEFLPGQSISLRSTAEALGISQMPVRQALSRLQAEGILVMHENRTLTVPKLTPALIMEKRDIRIALEGLAAELAAQRVSAGEIEELKVHFEAMQRSIRSTDVRRYIAENLKFHMCIYRAAGAPTLLSMIETIWAKFVAYARWANTDLALGTLNNHARALEGLTRRDAIMARSAIVQDCCDTYEIQLRLLTEHEPQFAAERGSLGSMVGPKRRGRPPKRTA